MVYRQKEETQQIKKQRKGKRQVHTTVRRTEKQCSNICTDWGNQVDVKNTRVDQLANKRIYFPEGKLIQDEGEVEHRAPNSLGSVYDRKVLNTAKEWWTQTYCLRREQTKNIERVPTYSPKRRDDSIGGKIFKVADGVEYRALRDVHWSIDGFYWYSYIDRRPKRYL